jgi:hypothetical protein
MGGGSAGIGMARRCHRECGVAGEGVDGFVKCMYWIRWGEASLGYHACCFDAYLSNRPFHYNSLFSSNGRLAFAYRTVRYSLLPPSSM